MWSVLQESNKANDGESNDCASGLIWCLCNYTKQCYHQQSMFGSCEEELMFGYLAQIDSSGQYCTGVCVCVCVNKCAVQVQDSWHSCMPCVCIRMYSPYQQIKQVTKVLHRKNAGMGCP